MVFLLILLGLAGFTMILAEVILKTGRKIMTSIDNLNAAIVNLTTAVNAAAAAITAANSGANPAIDTATSNIVSLTGALNNALTPPAPTPPAP